MCSLSEPLSGRSARTRRRFVVLVCFMMMFVCAFSAVRFHEAGLRALITAGRGGSRFRRHLCARNDHHVTAFAQHQFAQVIQHVVHFRIA